MTKGLIILSTIFMLTGCSGYEDGFKDGYDDGHTPPPSATDRRFLRIVPILVINID